MNKVIIKKITRSGIAIEDFNADYNYYLPTLNYESNNWMWLIEY